MELVWKKASAADLELLTESRVETLRAANGLSADADMEAVRAASRRYYAQALACGTHAAYLVFDGEKLVGTGGVSFFEVMPTVCSPSGKKAYIMNMYTHPLYRRRGIAKKTLDLLIAESRAHGADSVSLEATAMGRPLYESYGFTAMEHEMEYVL
ncbi:MAG TPA: GNAT family N-acetyltransferase [Candidatus Treponema faecavium]|nr:GNAT family N-acetyltransferase [Candidatus Treponema faecavium]